MIPAQAVEAAAVARGCVWLPAKANHPACEECLEQARTILEAAAPHMLAGALEDLADAADDPSAEDMGAYFIDQADVGRWIRDRAAALRAP